jgi:hypothetical protein
MAVKKFTTPVATPRASVGRMGSLRLEELAWRGHGQVGLQRLPANREGR